ncbi:hypothetical protein JXA05_01420 [Candidatus Peregrinibacteria bacterium]|nr:hypothetical protein [Candidatus Peregrinibacteria bacterium]
MCNKARRGPLIIIGILAMAFVYFGLSYQASFEESALMPLLAALLLAFILIGLLLGVFITCRALGMIWEKPVSVTRKQLIPLMTAGFLIALLVKILEATGLIGPISLPYHAILYPFAILWVYTDTIIEKLGYHPDIFWPDDVPPFLWEGAFMFLAIAISLAFYLACRMLRTLCQWGANTIKSCRIKNNCRSKSL